MLKLEEYAMYSLEEIEAEPNDILRHQLLTLRNFDIQKLCEDHFARKIVESCYRCSIYEIEETLELASYHHESQSLFPGQIVLLYPRITEQKASREITCDIYGGRIRIGSYYLRYQAFMDNLTNGKKYVLKRPWVAEIGTYDFFPKDISEMDHLDIALRNSYDLDSSYSPYDYYAISTRIGDGVQVTTLGPKNKVRKKIREQRKKLGL